MKVLYVATIARHIMSFHLPYLKQLKENGYEVHVACNNSEYNYKIPYTDKLIKLPFERSPLKVNNLKSFFFLKKIMNEENYDIIHCHTPVAGVITRMIHKKNSKARLFYTAHGFHFFKGAPLKNWIMYYPLEWLLSIKTDGLITINEEDYKRTIKFRATKKYLINGVGVDVRKFSINRDGQYNKIKKDLNISIESKVLFYAAELNENKNQQLLIKGMKSIVSEYEHAVLLLAGDGNKKYELNKLIIESGLKDHVFLLGQRNDISDLLKISDIIVSSSKREGLPVNLIEGLASGLPAVVTDCRGNRDLINDLENGFLYKNEKEFVLRVKQLLKDKKLYKKISENNIKKAQNYSITNIKNEIFNIYDVEKNQLKKRIL